MTCCKVCETSPLNKVKMKLPFNFLKKLKIIYPSLSVPQPNKIKFYYFSLEKSKKSWTIDKQTCNNSIITSKTFFWHSKTNWIQNSFKLQRLSEFDKCYVIVKVSLWISWMFYDSFNLKNIWIFIRKKRNMFFVWNFVSFTHHLACDCFWFWRWWSVMF